MKKNKMKLLLLSATTTLFLSGCGLIDYINIADDVKAREEQKALEKEAKAEAEANSDFSSKENETNETSDNSSILNEIFKDQNDETNDDVVDKSESNSDKQSSIDIEKEDNSSDFSDIFEATWVSSIDGDTIKIRKEDGTTEKVRLLLIDTPESVSTKISPQLYGHQASRYMKSLQKENQEITVKVGDPSQDDYGRLLAYVYLSNGEMLNEHLVRMGFARVAYIFPPNTQYLELLQSAQEQAKNEKLLIWSVDGYVTDNGFNMDVVTNEDVTNSVEQTKDLY